MNGKLYKLEACTGSNSGEALYLNDQRIHGGKCWGWVRPKLSFNMTLGQIDELIKKLQAWRDEEETRLREEILEQYDKVAK